MSIYETPDTALLPDHLVHLAAGALSGILANQNGAEGDSSPALVGEQAAAYARATLSALEGGRK